MAIANREILNYMALTQYKKDPTEAVKLFRWAAEDGSLHAWRSLGIAYMYGKGVKQDYFQAIKCLQRSGDMGKELLHKLKDHLKREIAELKHSRAMERILPRSRLLFN